MTRHFRLLTALLLAGASISIAACGDDDGGGGGDDDRDSGTSEEDAGRDSGSQDSGTPNRDGGGTGGGDGGGMDGGTDAEVEPPLSACPDHPNVTTTSMYCVIDAPTGSEVTEDLTLEPVEGKRGYIINRSVFVGEDVGGKASAASGKKRATLTIKPGTQLFGADNLSFLSINRGSKIIAEGTKDKPIVFGSAKSSGKAPGDWGGIVINGRAPHNKQSADGDVIGEAGTGTYGGPDEDDNSGVIKYVRIEFGGGKVDSENELNGLTLQGVGRGTLIDYLHVHANDDDGIEFFGGAADAKHIIITGASDDSIDWTSGWTGRVQFAIAQQWDHTNPGSGGNDAANGIEADNDSSTPEVTPISAPVFSNVTLVGNPEIDHPGWGMLLRRGTYGQFHNFVVLNYKNACISVRSQRSADAAGDELAMKNSRIYCETSFDATGQGEPAIVAGAEGMFEASGTGNEVLADENAAVEDAYARPGDFKAKSALLSGGEAPDDDFFEDVDFIGAVGDNDWTEGEWYKLTEY